MQGGTLSFVGVELLRSIEAKDVKHFSTMLPSRASLQLHTWNIDLIVQCLCPFKPCEENNQLWEIFSFDNNENQQDYF